MLQIFYYKFILTRNFFLKKEIVTFFVIFQRFLKDFSTYKNFGNIPLLQIKISNCIPYFLYK